MSDAEQKLLRELLRDAYRAVNPDLSDWGDHLCRKLAEGLYARGARIQIGAAQPPTYVNIHHSVDPLGNILWTCRRWNQVMGYHSQAPVGRHISEFLDPGTYQMYKNHWWPELVREGRLEGLPVILVTATKDYLNATGKTEVLRDEEGAFYRTFAKLKVAVPAALARLAGVLLLWVYSGTTSVALLM